MTRRHTVHVGRAPDGFTVQAHRWDGHDLTGSGQLMHRPTLESAHTLAAELVRHRLACGRPCILTTDPDMETPHD